MGIAFEVHSRHILSNQQFCKNKAVNGLPHRKKKKTIKQTNNFVRGCESRYEYMDELH
jgi:hypothetical protein